MAVGGVDPSGGAGLARDFATATARGAAALLVGTAWTTQSRRGVASVEPRAPGAVRDALLDALEQARRGYISVKVGMVATPAIARAVVRALEGFAGPVVFDPVLGATSGGSLFAGKPKDLGPLIERASLTTPNLDEARALANEPALRVIDDVRRAAHALRSMGARAVLIKGGHLLGDAMDLLAWAEGERIFRAARIAGPSPRGTGCALASAIAVELARGKALPQAVRIAKRWLTASIRTAHPVGGEIHLGTGRAR